MQAALRVRASHGLVDRGPRLLERLMEDGGQRRSRIFDICVERSGCDRGVAYERAAEVHAAVDFASRRFELLRDELTENDGLREVFRADNDRFFRARRQQQERKKL